MGAILTIKKYPNRRLYDTEQSRYITLQELIARIQAGRDVQVLDAQTHEDLTQATLVHLLVEGDRAALLPVPVLRQLVRMKDDALAEFYGSYMTWALDLYFGMKQRAAASMNPFAHAPYDMGSALAGMFLGAQPPERSGSAGPPPEEASSGSEVAAMRRELDALKESLKLRKPRRANRR